MNFTELLAAEFAPYSSLNPAQLLQLQEHFDLLLRWNQKINLTRIQNVQDAVRLHYCESLLAGTLLPPGSLKIADVGSGAGFPGIPIKVIRPECSMDLIESHQRKSVFLREAGQNVGAIVRPVRAETVSQRYDWIVARAVRPSDILSLRLAENVAILMSGDQVEGLAPFRIEKLPWGQDHILAMFHVKL